MSYREIKFRVFWVHPESDSQGFDYFKLNETYVEGDPCQVFDQPEQYTGLEDFYEGDIVKLSGGDLTGPETEQITFEDHMFMVGDYSLYFANENYTLERIGNIHENGDLL
jgi:hypothetical protein